MVKSQCNGKKCCSLIRAKIRNQAEEGYMLIQTEKEEYNVSNKNDKKI